MKDGKRKRKLGAALAEIIGEIALTLIAAAIGFGIFKLFGADGDFIDRNFDLMVLVGLFVPILAIAAAVTILIKICGPKKEQKKTGSDIILDTDVGADCDDMMALAYLAYAERESLISLKAVTHSNSCEHGIPAIRAHLKAHGMNIPVGRAAGEVAAYDHYARQVAERFADGDCYAPADDAVTVLRRALTESYDATLLAIGPMTNIAALLESAPDEASTLCGVSLVLERCKRVVLMAGDFVSGKPEWNVKLDVGAMKTVLEKCPVPIYILPFECGADMITGAQMLDGSYPENPTSLAFRLFPGTKELGGRHSWDPAAALFAVIGDGEYFRVSEPLSVSVDGDGVTRAESNARGMHRIISVNVKDGETEAEAKARAAEYIDACVGKLYFD